MHRFTEMIRDLWDRFWDPDELTDTERALAALVVLAVLTEFVRPRPWSHHGN